ncbi:class I SAM-dependent methyltransferase [Pontimicrobium sp. IMCC45349]|uniref:class I SAM-dependent methyltransferase n=1 Tax=Pontimicrobium sp. IMCC45349 TaxID=3391574 RepID=UPI0039A2D7BF
MKRKVEKIINKLFGLFGLKVTRKNKAIQKNEFPIVDVLNGEAKIPFNSVPFAAETLQFFVENYDFSTVLDIGSGEGKHSDVLKEVGKKVTSIDYGRSVYFEKRSENHTCVYGDYYEYEFEEKFDAIWASHVLEHQPNPNLFLKKIFNDLKEGGVLAITVPPLKHEIVGGHVTLWNAGLLIYQLVLAGFNCHNVSVKSYGYNISVVLVKETINLFPELSFDKGDIDKLIKYFPEGYSEPFNGDIKEINWVKRNG